MKSITLLFILITVNLMSQVDVVVLKDINQKIAKNESDGQLYYTRGRLYYNAGEFLSALADFNQAIDLGVKTTYAYWSCAMAQEDLGYYSIAIRSYGNAIKIYNSKDYDEQFLDQLYYNRASLLIKQKLYFEAIQDFNKVIELDPKNEHAVFNLAVCKIELEDYRGAISDFKKIIETSSDEGNVSEAYYNSGMCKYKLKDYKGAILDLDISIKRTPKNVDAYTYRGLSKLVLNQKESGCLDFSKSGELGNKKAYELISTFCK